MPISWHWKDPHLQAEEGVPLRSMPELEKRSYMRFRLHSAHLHLMLAVLMVDSGNCRRYRLRTHLDILRIMTFGCL